jgi:hypothetical protein
MSYDGLLINTCTIKRRDFDKWGDVSSTTLVPNQKCRFMRIIKLIRDFKGEEKISVGKFFFKRNAVLEHQDLILFDGIDYAILKINKPQNSITHHHTEVWVD